MVFALYNRKLWAGMMLSILLKPVQRMSSDSVRGVADIAINKAHAFPM
jgi:hypothetical protein